MPEQPPLELYCICRQPESLEMIACDNCEDWFHAACFGINLMEIADIANFPFTCHACKHKATIADDSGYDLIATEQLKLERGVQKP